ncbi:hypothetical protein [Prosthecobacter sp.]|uniref:hypothetical protein n=1 Tax=Prosthecobacter sp. TaxID=1965333 RepID=UPI0037835534
MPTWLQNCLIVGGSSFLFYALLCHFFPLPNAKGRSLAPGSRAYQEIAEAPFAQLFWQNALDPHRGSRLQHFCFLSCEGQDPAAAFLHRPTRAALAVRPRSMLGGERFKDWYNEFRTLCGSYYFCASFDKVRKQGRNQVSVEVGEHYGPTFGRGDIYEGRKEKGRWVFK